MTDAVLNTKVTERRLLFLYAVVHIASCTLKRLYMNIYDRIASI